MQNQLPQYEPPPPWIPPEERRYHPDYDNDIRQFLPRPVALQRQSLSESFGFNFRGGAEHHCGIYVSKVMPNSNAHRVGLKEADQILSVNEVDFKNIEHSDAVSVLKSFTDVHLVVQFFPYGYQKTYERSQVLAAMQNSPSPQR